MQREEWWHALRRVCWNGGRLVCARRRSFGVERMAPMIIIAAILCTLASCDVKLLVPLPSDFLLLPLDISSAHQTSAVYNIFGKITPSYKCLIHFPLIPFVVLVIWLHASAYFVPLAKALAACSLNHNSWSMIMPRNLCELEGSMVCPLSIMDGQCTGTVFLGFSVLGVHCLERHTNAVLSSSNSVLCFRLQSSAPPGFSIIFLSLSFASS